MEHYPGKVNTLVQLYQAILKQMMKEVNSKAFKLQQIFIQFTMLRNLQDYFDTFGKKLNHCHFMDYKMVSVHIWHGRWRS